MIAGLIFFAIFFTIITVFRFHYALFLLLLLLPTYLIRFPIGPIPSTLLEVMVGIVVTVWIFKEIRNWKLEIGKSKPLVSNFQFLISEHRSLCIAIVLFLTAATISIFTSLDTRSALGVWKAFYIEPFLIFLVLVTTQKSKKTKKQESNITIEQCNNVTIQQYNNLPIIQSILFALILCGLATSILAIYQHFTGWMVPHAFWANGNSYRVTAWYGFPNGVGLFLAPLIPLAIFLLHQSFIELRTRNWKLETRNLVLWLVLISNFLFLISAPFAILFAKSTGGLVGIAAGLGVLLLYYKKTRVPAIVLAIAGILTLTLLPNTNSIKRELLMQDRSGQIRVSMWGEATEFLSDNPIRGAGLASYSKRIVPYHTQVHGENIEIFHHPHNIFLTMWVNLGILGLIGFVWIVVWFYRVGLMKLIEIRNWKLETRNTKIPISNFKFPISNSLKPNTYNLIPYLVSSMTTLITTGLVDSPYIKNDLSIFFWLLPALLVIETRHTYNKQQ